jgi:outer membrane phospholipase A
MAPGAFPAHTRKATTVLRKILIASSLLILAPIAFCDVMLVPKAVSVPGGAIVTVEVMVTNGGAGPMTWTVKKTLAARLHSGSSRSEDVVLTTAIPEGGRAIPPGGYLQLPYQFGLQPGLFGPVVLELTQVESEPAMFSVLSYGEDATRASVAAEHPADDQDRVAHETALRRSTQLLPGLSQYEPVYFGVGADGGLNAKFQLSFKYQPFDLIPAYFSYSQTSLWDLHDSSAPFYDTSYRPRVFFQEQQLWVSENKKVWFGLESGLAHESNGHEAGDQEHSIYLAYVRPRLDWAAPDDYHLFISPMVYGYIDKADNPDIADYRGYADLLIGLSKNGWRLNTTLRKGAKDHYGSIEVNAVLPLRSSDQFFDRIGAHGLNGYWFVQYFNGWGETILDYNLKLKAQFRTGLMVVP